MNRMLGTSAAINALGLSSPPVAIGFLDALPSGVSRWSGGAVPAGCVFWRQAMQGKTFYTEPSDHWNCAVGSYTHAISIPPERGPVLQDTIGLMVKNGYLEMPEIPGIPVLAKTPKFIAYAPLEDAAFEAAVVLLAARPADAMLIYEAAIRSGAAEMPAPALGRPACAVLPLAASRHSAAFSLGCKGNRTFTGLPDSELYFCIPGEKWDAFAGQLETLQEANRKMADYYLQHQAQFPILQ